MQGLIFFHENIDWHELGACNFYPSEWWFPTTHSKKGKIAKNICKNECPVYKKCLDWSLRLQAIPGNYEMTGIYAGLTRDERVKLLKKENSDD